MGVGQNLVDFADPAQSPGDRIEAGEPPTGRAAGPQRPDAAKPAGGRWLPAHLIATGAPAREAESLGRHVVQRRGKCCKALAKTRGVDRVMRRREPHPNGTKPGEVVQATGHGGARLRAAAGAAGEGIAQGVEQRESERAGGRSCLLLHNGRRDIGQTQPVEGDAGVDDAGAFAILQQHRAGLWLCRPQRWQRDGQCRAPGR